MDTKRVSAPKPGNYSNPGLYIAACKRYEQGINPGPAPKAGSYSNPELYIAACRRYENGSMWFLRRLYKKINLT